MKLTPLDIHHKEFSNSLRGYNQEQVDQFLDDVADEFERLFKENIDLSEKMDALQQKVNEFELQRQTINNTLMAAQRSAEDIQQRANTEAEATLKDAEVKAKEIIHAALSQKQQVQSDLVRIKQAEEDFRTRFQTMLDEYRAKIGEIELPKDVEVMIGETESGVVSDVAVKPSPAPVSASTADEVFDGLDLGGNADTPVEATHVDAAFEPAPMVEEDRPKATLSEADGPATFYDGSADLAPRHFDPAPVAPSASGDAPAAAAADEPPTSGFVHSVALGEVADFDSGPEIPDLEEPGDFDLPSFRRLGERDDDMDIEEID